MNSAPELLRLPTRHLANSGLLLPTVYCWMFPQVRHASAELMADYPHDLFLRNIHPGLDDAHDGVLNAYERVLGSRIRGWNSFAFRYPTAGSSEALFHLLAAHATSERDLPLYVMPDEYHGYRAYAESLRLSAIELDESELLRAPPGRVIISWPSARDGQVPDESLLGAILDRHRVVLDLAYLGLTDPFDLAIDHPNIDAVVASLSKPFGLYYHRIGFCWSRHPMPSLYGTRWFKNLHSILLGQRVIESVGWSLLPWIRRWQQRAVEHVRDHADLDLLPCDVALLATASANRPITQLERFRRGDLYRVCLTPLMMDLAGDGAPVQDREAPDA